MSRSRSAFTSSRYEDDLFKIREAEPLSPLKIVLTKFTTPRLKSASHVALLPVVVPLHLEVEDLAFCSGGLHDKMLVQEGQHLVTDLTQLLLNLLKN